VLAPYRERGVGKRLLCRALTEAAKDASVEDVYLHVQTSNTEALAFYQAFGFEVKETIAGYYKRIEPPDCHVLGRSLRGWVAPAGLALEADESSERALEAP